MFEREMVDVDGVGVLVGRPANAKGDYSSAGLAAVQLDPDTRRWTDLSYPKPRNAGDLVSYLPQPLHAADGKVVSASFFGDRLGYGRPDSLVGGILDLDDGWSALPTRPLSAVERKARAEAQERRDAVLREHGPNAGISPEDAEPQLERFPWLNVGGDGFVVAGRWALDVERGTWQHVPTEGGPVRLADASAVWAGDRVFAWGGSGGGRANVATGWTWRPAHSPSPTLLDLG